MVLPGFWRWNEMNGLDLKVEFKLSQNLLDLEKNLRSSSFFAQKGVGFFAQDEIENAINTSGYGTWPNLKDITVSWHKSETKSPLAFLSRFVKSESLGNKVKAGFLPGKKVYSKFLDRYVFLQEKGAKIQVTKRMRGYFAHKGEIKRGKSTLRDLRKKNLEKESFPLKVSTKFLVIPKRPIISLAFPKVQKRASMVFEKKFIPNFEAKYK